MTGVRSAQWFPPPDGAGAPRKRRANDYSDSGAGCTLQPNPIFMMFRASVRSSRRSRRSVPHARRTAQNRPRHQPRPRPSAEGNGSLQSTILGLSHAKPR